MQSAPEHVVIIGGGVAAHNCARELRRQGFAGAVTMVSAEPHLPYDRTLLSKEFLEGLLDEEDLALSSAGEYADLGVELRLGVPVTGIDPAARRVHLQDGSELAYDRAVIATGGAARRPGLLTVDGTRTVRTLDDAKALGHSLAELNHLLIVGAGFVGGEIAATATALGTRVTLIEALPTPMAGVLGNEVGEQLAELHREAGVEMLAGTAATGVREGSGRIEVTTADGSTLVGDALVVGAGMLPNLAWLRGSGVEVDGGVITDELCQTNVPGVLAAGDCARWWNPRYEQWMQVEHWDTAGRHGAAAARSALGRGEGFDPVPFFWSNLRGTRLQSVGNLAAWDEVQLAGSSPHSFVARYFRNERMVAAFAAGNAGAIRTAKRDLEEEVEAPA